MKLTVYCDDVLACVFRQFEKRGFTFKQTMPVGYSVGIANGQAAGSSEILFNGKLVGSLDIRFRRSTRRIKRYGIVVNSHHPITQELLLDVKSVASRWERVNFGIPSTIAFFHSRLLHGRPKVRRWAVYAAKELLVHTVNREAKFIHDQ